MQFVMSVFQLTTTMMLVCCCTFLESYDPLDPTGEITVTFDIFKWTDDGYTAKVTIQNLYQYRQIGKPGWKIGWEWTNKEIIWSMAGAFATSQGDCTNFPYRSAHCCQNIPEIADWGPDAPPEVRSESCCHGGILSARAIDPSNSLTSFEITVGNLNINHSAVSPPANLTLLAPGLGYTCSPVSLTQPSKSSDIGGQRIVQVYKTWKSTCTYSSFVANKKPMCCVSLSSFYNPKVTKCPECSCGCKESNNNTIPCISDGSAYTSSLSNLNNVDLLKCSDHMCPVRVHWHIKNIYETHWRVKLTVSNYNYKRTYSDWNVLVQHPGFGSKTTSYSFNSTILPTIGFTDKAAIFWGIQYVNGELLEAKEEVGSVSTEILIEKDLWSFTLSNGWGFPRRIYFGGEECQMPFPDSFPMLPNGTSNIKITSTCIFLLILVYITSIILFTWV